MTLVLSVSMCTQALAQSDSMDRQLSDLTESLAGQITKHAKKKVTVLDFTDLQGGSSELGRYIAEQLTVNLVLSNRDFAVLDRANLKSILAEHKLTAKGLVDPENAKKLGMFAGVDALILGTIMPAEQDIQLTAKVITTDTAEIVGAARARFRTDVTVKELLSHSTTEAKTGDITEDSGGDEAASVMKTFGDLRVEFRPLRISNGNELLLTASLANQNTKKSIWVSLRGDIATSGIIHGRITDSGGSEYFCQLASISGIGYASYEKARYGYGGGDSFSPATEIKPGDSITITIKLVGSPGKPVAPGKCSLQMEFLVGHDFGGNAGSVTINNFVGDLKAN